MTVTFWESLTRDYFRNLSGWENPRPTEKKETLPPNGSESPVINSASPQPSDPPFIREEIWLPVFDRIQCVAIGCFCLLGELPLQTLVALIDAVFHGILSTGCVVATIVTLGLNSTVRQTCAKMLAKTTTALLIIPSCIFMTATAFAGVIKPEIYGFGLYTHIAVLELRTRQSSTSS